MGKAEIIAEIEQRIRNIEWRFSAYWIDHQEYQSLMFRARLDLAEAEKMP